VQDLQHLRRGWQHEAQLHAPVVEERQADPHGPRDDTILALGPAQGWDCLGELLGPLCSPFLKAPHLGEGGGHPAVVDEPIVLRQAQVAPEGLGVDVALRRGHPADRVLEDVGGLLFSLACHALAFLPRKTVSTPLVANRALRPTADRHTAR